MGGFANGGVVVLVFALALYNGKCNQLYRKLFVFFEGFNSRLGQFRFPKLVAPRRLFKLGG